MWMHYMHLRNMPQLRLQQLAKRCSPAGTCRAKQLLRKLVHVSICQAFWKRWGCPNTHKHNVQETLKCSGKQLNPYLTNPLLNHSLMSSLKTSDSICMCDDHTSQLLLIPFEYQLTRTMFTVTSEWYRTRVCIHTVHTSEEASFQPHRVQKQPASIQEERGCEQSLPPSLQSQKVNASVQTIK